MNTAVQSVLRLLVAAAFLFILLSLGNLSVLSTHIIRVMAGGSFVLMVLAGMFIKERKAPPFLGRWLAFLLIWLLLQQAAIVFRFPGFDIPAGWTSWYAYFGLVAAGFALYAVSQSAFSDRVALSAFLHYFVAASTCLGVYFIFVFFTSGVPVEKIQPPFPALQYLGPLAGVSLQPNNLVDLFIPGFFFSISLAFYNYRRKLNHSDPGRAYSEIFLHLCYACVLIAATLYTKSRAGIISFLAAFAFYFLVFSFAPQQRRSPLKFLSVVVIISLCFVSSLGLKQIFQELGTLKDVWSLEIEKMGTRTATIGASWQLVKSHGVLGVGLGNFHMGWLLLHKAPYTMFPKRSYNDLLWLWSEMGLPGILCLAGGVLWCLFRGVRTSIASSSCYISYLTNAAMASLVAFVVHSAVDPTFYVEALFLQICIVMGIASACTRLEYFETRETETWELVSFRVRVFRLLFGVGFLLMIFIEGIQIAAGYVGSKGDISSLERASRMDPMTAVYPRLLAARYYESFAKQPSEESIAKALQAMDEAIRRDPMNLTYYRKRAELMLRASDPKGVHQSFDMLQERLPDFYLGELTAVAFYMDASLDLQDADEASRFKALALRHYARAVDLNPRLAKHLDLYPQMSLQARQEFDAMTGQQAS